MICRGCLVEIAIFRQPRSCPWHEIESTVRRYNPRSCARHCSEALKIATMTTNASSVRREHRDGDLESKAATIDWTSIAGIPAGAPKRDLIVFTMTDGVLLFQS